jgi:probable F420-dependent oxidoreductase
MQFGVILPNFSRLGTREANVQIAQEAEALGYDSIWTTDHVMVPHENPEPYGHVLESIVMLSYLAPLTSRVKLGTSIIVLPQREPVLAAKQLATLDDLSGGRLIVGLGIGWNQKEYGFLGASFHNRGRRMDEYIRVLKELWTSAEPAFDGEFVKFGDCFFSPRSPQPGGPPILIGGFSEAAFRRAATLGDGWHATAPSVEDFATGMRRVRELAQGRPMTGSLRIRVTFDRTLPSRTSGSGYRSAHLDGSADEIAEKLRAYQQAGVDTLVAHFGVDDLSSFVEDMRRFASEIRPRFAGG